MAKLGLITCKDIWKVERGKLQHMLGARLGDWLWHRARGIDHRKVITSRQRKSLGSEETFSSDITDINILESELSKISEKVFSALRKRQLQGRTVTVKIKYSNFQSITRSETLSAGVTSQAALFEVAMRLLLKTEAGSRPIRLLGVSLSSLLDIALRVPD